MSKTAKLNNLIEQMQKALSEGEKELESQSFPIGLRGIFSLISDFQGKLYVHVRKFNDIGKPTQKGVALTDREFKELIDINNSVNIDMIIEEMKQESEPPAKRKRTEQSTKTKRKFFKATI